MNSEEPMTQHGAPRPEGRGGRTCVGCRAPAELGSSVRLVLDAPDDAGGARGVAVDFAGGSFGRGAHVHARPECLAKACSGGLAKAFRCAVSATPAGIAVEIARGGQKRIEGLLLGARRAGLLAFGEEARGLAPEGAALFVVANDAGPSALGGALRAAVADGRALVFGTREELGRLFSRELVALVAVRHEAVAKEIRGAKNLVEAVASAASGRSKVRGAFDAGVGRFDE